MEKYYQSMVYCSYQIPTLLRIGILAQLIDAKMIRMIIGFIIISILSYQARRDLNDPENAIIGAFAGNLTF